MAPTRQRTIASGMMTVGVLPFGLIAGWSITFLLTSTPGQPPAVPIIDPFVMISLLLTTYMFMCAVAGSGALWSWFTTARNPPLRSRTAMIMRLATALLIAAPPLMTLLTGER